MEPLRASTRASCVASAAMQTKPTSVASWFSRFNSRARRHAPRSLAREARRPPRRPRLPLALRARDRVRHAARRPRSPAHRCARVALFARRETARRHHHPDVGGPGTFSCTIQGFGGFGSPPMRVYGVSCAPNIVLNSGMRCTAWTACQCSYIAGGSLNAPSM